MIASEGLAQLSKALDDPGLVHHEDVALIALSEAQRVVALRFRLVRETASLALADRIPLYRLQEASPRGQWVLHMTLDGETLWPVPLPVLRLKDPAWMVTRAVPTHFYRVGLTRVGVYPVPNAAMSAEVTLLVAPPKLTTLGQALVVPEAYLPEVVEVAKGLLLITGERAIQDGMASVTKGLQVPQRPRLTERQGRHVQD